MPLENEITALRQAVERLAELPAALDRLTQAVNAHAATRLAIFERAGQEALAAIPLVPGEDEAAALKRMEVPFTDPPRPLAPPVTLRTPVSLAEVQAVATEMVRSGERALLQEALVNKIGVGSIGQLSPEQRIRFMDLALDAGWLPHTQAETEVKTPAERPSSAQARMPAAANQPHDEPPPVEVTAAEALTLARQLIEAGRGPLVKEVLVNQIKVKSLEHLTPAQRVEFVRLVNGAVQGAA